jgi:DNA-binding SARP family transcriptional activator
MAWVRRLITAIINTVLVAALAMGPPIAFMRYDGASVLKQIVLYGSDGQPAARQAAPLMILAIVGVFWLLLLASVLMEIGARVRGVSVRRIPLLFPAQGLASVLMAGQVVSLLSPAAASAAVPPVLPSATQSAAPVHTDHRQDITAVLARTHATYVVKRGDYLAKIAKNHLGNANRWTEICDLNWHRHFAVGGTLRDCDLIYPGWDLRLPTDAIPPKGATPVQPPTTQTPPVVIPPTGVPSPVPSTHVSPSPSGPLSTAPGMPSTAPASSSPVTSSPAVPQSPSASPGDDGAESLATDEHGVQLSSSSWLPWALAVAISAAAVLVWLQRRRRYTGQPDDDPPTELPEPVVKLCRAVARNPQLVRPDGRDAEPPALVPDLAPLPLGGTGITGDGAAAAARAALVAVLASGGPHHPDARGEVVIDAATLATLLGSDVVTLGAWPRLHLADSVDDALTVIESRLLHRSRILDEHALTDLDELRQQVPDEEALPPVMLITETPPAGAHMRAKVALALGGGLHLTGLLLGEWAHGATIEVAPDGHTKLVAGHSADPVPARLPVLDPAAAIQILTTLREAQTGEPPAIVSPAVPVTVVPLHASRTSATQDEPQQQPDAAPATPAVPVAATATGRAKLRVIGPPRIEDIVHDGRPLRAKAKELAVYLAVHPDGAATKDIGDHIELDARISQAAQRVHTNASNLRHVLGRAGNPEASNAYVIKSGGRYRLDPATVDVDVWTLRDLMRKATIASGPARRELLTAACDLYTAPLAQGEDYEWLAPHRETVRRWGTEAHLHLADDLLDNHPQQASDLLDKAIGLDRYNEALYVKAMHARHALGDADGIRTLLRALTKALADLDAEPQDDTRTLAAKLRTSLEQK